MAQVVPQRSPAIHRTTSSAPSYFEIDPATQCDRAFISNALAMESTHVHRLDAFHERYSLFPKPQNTHIYAARPLPPVPARTLRRPSSVKSFRSLAPVSPRRPGLTLKDRTVTADCIGKSLPPLPLRLPANHRRGLSIESTGSDKPSESDSSETSVGRPRASRSISFRNYFNRSTCPEPIEAARAGSALSNSTESTRNSRHDSVVIDDMSLPMGKSTSPTSSAPGSRRPSTLSLASLRPRKTSNESVPALPVRPVSRKGSQSQPSNRWGLFGKNATEKVEEFIVEDLENAPPLPVTPTTAELNCHRCYYYSMRNCNGWVIGGTHGEACENCTMHGFFGSP